MGTGELQPKGTALVIAAVHKLDEAKKRREQADRDVAEAEHALEQLIRAGNCQAHDQPGQSKPGLPKPGLPKPGDKNYPALDDPGVKKCWRIGFYLWREGRLDYQYVADRVWGQGLDAMTAKNRVNAHLTELKKDKVVKAKGDNLYEVNAKLLADRSRIQLPKERPAVE